MKKKPSLGAKINSAPKPFPREKLCVGAKGNNGTLAQTKKAGAFLKCLRRQNNKKINS